MENYIDSRTDVVKHTEQLLTMTIKKTTTLIRAYSLKTINNVIVSVKKDVFEQILSLHY